MMASRDMVFEADILACRYSSLSIDCLVSIVLKRRINAVR